MSGLTFLSVMLIFLQHVSVVPSFSPDEIPIIENTLACSENKPQIVNHSFGFFVSPGFDAFHFLPQNLNCTWILQAPQGQAVNFHFLQFLMADCKKATLEIFDGTSDEFPLMAFLCGRSSIRTRFQSKSSNLFIRLISGQDLYFPGFQAYFEHSLPDVQTCPGESDFCRNRFRCFSETERCNKIMDCSDGTDEENCDYDIPEFKCGLPDITPYIDVNRIVGGVAARPNSWPWQISMRTIYQEPLGHQCGAVLIHPQWIITAAHCFREIRDSNYWIIVLGRHHKFLHDPTDQIRYIDTIYSHPEYKGLEVTNNLTWLQKKENDVALIKLNAPVILNEFVQPACLPEEDRYVGPATMGFTLGWGTTYGTGNDFVLKQAAVPIVPRAICQLLYPFYEIGKSMLCAGFIGGGHDACNGDSGGALVQQEPKNQSWTLIGITCTGGICGAKKEPGIYTEVSKFVSWIRDIISRRTSNIKS